MIFVFTGNGKGKTTTAIGQGIRAVGQGSKVFMIQFIKGNQWTTGEESVIKELSPRFQLIKGGKGFVGILGDTLPRSIHKEAAQNALALAQKKINSGRFHLIILDEVNVALSLKLVSLKNVLAVIKKVPKEMDIILTGRNCPKQLIKIADLVTECKEIKHYYQKGIIAKRNREY